MRRKSKSPGNSLYNQLVPSSIHTMLRCSKSCQGTSTLKTKKSCVWSGKWPREPHLGFGLKQLEKWSDILYNQAEGKLCQT
jgi:hypothetical protein